eukprot:gene6084-10092_t
MWKDPNEEVKIEDVMSLIYQESNDYPSIDQVLRSLYSLKIFTLNSFIHELCIDKEKLQKSISIQDKIVFSKFVHEVSTIVLLEPMQIASNFTNQILSTGCNKLDELLKGGIRTKMITEIAGSSSSGKTQISLQLLLQTVLSEDEGGLSGSSAYFSTKDFPLNRLKQISTQRYSKENLLDNIIVQHIQNEEELYKNLQNLSQIIEKRKIKLLIIDSIASLFRISSKKEELFKRSESLFQISSFLKNLAYKFDLCIVVINEVSSVFLKEDDLPSLFDGEKVKPALGLTWENCVNVRIQIENTKMKLNEDLSSTVRRMKLIFSPYAVSGVSQFIINKTGIQDTEIC